MDEVVKYIYIIQLFIMVVLGVSILRSWTTALDTFIFTTCAVQTLPLLQRIGILLTLTVPYIMYINSIGPLVDKYNICFGSNSTDHT